MFSVEDDNTNRILDTTFLSCPPKEEVEGFQETHLAVHPQMTFIEVLNSFGPHMAWLQEKMCQKT